MKLCEAIQKIEAVIPPAWAEEWDNPGLTVGDPSANIFNIALALDVTPQTVSDAISKDCQLLLTHHPAIFHPVKSIINERPVPKAIIEAIKNGLALYAAHTNWDYAENGVNMILANLLSLKNIYPLVPSKNDNGAWGLGAVGELNEPLDLCECVALLKERWQSSILRAYGNMSHVVKKIAIGGGACGDLWPAAFDSGAELFITADVAYHNRQDMLGMGLNCIVVDHGEMERLSIPALASVVESATGLTTHILDEIKVDWAV